VVHRRHVIAVALAAAAAIARGQSPVVAPNFVAVAPRLATSGQPSAEALKGLASLGYQAVVYLAPSSVPSAVASEAELLSQQGIEFVHIPIPFGAPEEAHLLALAQALDRLRERTVLVHCEINMRASTIVFLYRAVHRGEDPASAYEAVAKVWSPRGVWHKLVVAQLAKNNIKFEPY
jgi:protein tyrosine phosphatase (PTP) superfamily phosphohydrolase (DUF442 family)